MVTTYPDILSLPALIYYEPDSILRLFSNYSNSLYATPLYRRLFPLEISIRRILHSQLTAPACCGGLFEPRMHALVPAFILADIAKILTEVRYGAWSFQYLVTLTYYGCRVHWNHITAIPYFTYACPRLAIALIYLTY
jgi:hypothetical protein